MSNPINQLFTVDQPRTGLRSLFNNVVRLLELWYLLCIPTAVINRGLIAVWILLDVVVFNIRV